MVPRTDDPMCYVLPLETVLVEQPVNHPRDLEPHQVRHLSEYVG